MPLRELLADWRADCACAGGGIRFLLATGESATAREAARSAVSAAPYSEEMWQLLMRAEAALAGGEAVASIFLECPEALREIDLEPCGATVRLVERLRA